MVGLSQTAPGVVQIKRGLHVPPETVFSALTSSGAWRRWFSVLNPLKIGVHLKATEAGDFRIQFAQPCGNLVEFRGEFREIVAPTFILIACSITGTELDDVVDSHIEFRVEASDDGCTLDFRHAGLRKASVERLDCDWTRSFDLLERHLANETLPDRELVPAAA